MPKVDFAIAKSFDDFIGSLPAEVGAEQFLYLLLANSNTPKLLHVTTVLDLTKERKVAVKNYLGKNFDNSKKLAHLNEVLINNSAS